MSDNDRHGRLMITAVKSFIIHAHDCCLHSQIFLGTSYGRYLGMGPYHTTNKNFLSMFDIVKAGNTKGGSITVPLTSCLAGLD